VFALAALGYSMLKAMYNV